MNFDDERFVKIYPRNTTNWKLLGWEGRCVLMMLLREVDRAGCLDIEGGMEGLALLLDLPPDVTVRGFVACVKRGSVVQNGNLAIIPNFVRAQDARQTDRVRQAESRARRREVAMSQTVTNVTRTVTDCDQPSHAVTPSHTESHDVTLRLDQNRSEQTNLSCAKPDQSQPELALVPQQAADASPKPAKPTEAQVRDRVARALYAEIVAARKSVIASARLSPDSAPKPAGLAGLRASLGQGYTPEQIRHAIKLKVAEVRADPEQGRWFVAKWFHPANIDRYSELTEADVAQKPRNQAPHAVRPPEPPKSPQGIESDFQRRRKELESAQ